MEVKAFILARAKAFVGALIPALAFTVLTVAESTFGFELGNETKVFIVSAITGGVVHQVPNRSV